MWRRNEPQLAALNNRRKLSNSQSVSGPEHKFATHHNTQASECVNKVLWSFLPQKWTTLIDYLNTLYQLQWLYGMRLGVEKIIGTRGHACFIVVVAMWRHYVSAQLGLLRVFCPSTRWVNMKQRWNDTDKGKPNDLEKILSQSHFVHRLGLTWAPTRASAVRRLRLTAWAIARLWAWLTAR
jgi:hypothetical protein